MATWAALLRAEPAIASKGRKLLYLAGVGIGFLGTVRRDGGPRVHAVSPILADDALFVMVIPGPKLGDLRRDNRYSLHSLTSPPPNHDDAFFAAGTASERPDTALWDEVAAQLLSERDLTDRWPGFEDMVLFELELDRVLLTLTHPGDGLKAGRHVWRPQ